MLRPCECGCENYKHEPRYSSGRSFNMDENRTYGACYICDDCMRFEEMGNLKFLEWLSGQI